MYQENKAIVLYGSYDLRLEKLPVPTPNKNEVLVEMGCVGICGSDLTLWKNFSQGSMKITNPTVIGHEPAGTILEVGDDVKNLKRGDKVAIEPIIPCSSCEFCKKGTYNHCENTIFSGIYPKDGALKKYYTHHAKHVYKLDEHVTLEEGALLQPLSIAIHAVKRGGVVGNSKVMIIGAGTIGLCTLLASKAFGASKVIISDVIESRLEKAKELGADYVYKVDDREDPNDTLKNMLKIFNERPTVSFECVGKESCVRIALEATKTTGTLVIVGLGVPDYTLPIFDAIRKEVDIRGSYRLCNDYPTALELVTCKKINIKPLVTHRFGIENYQKAFELADKEKDKCIKVMFHL